MGPAILRASASPFEFEPGPSLFAAAHQRKFDALPDPKIVKPSEQIADSGNGFAVQSGNDVPWSDTAPCALRSNQTGTIRRRSGIDPQDKNAFDP